METFEYLATESTILGIIIRFTINLITLIVLIKFIYFRYSKKESYVFSFFMVGTVIFLIVSLLVSVDIKLGMALGLFAVFGILKFRTVNYSSKDMAYFFAVIGISIINSQAKVPPPVIGAITINSIIIITAWVLEVLLKRKKMSSYVVKINNPELLKPASKPALLKLLSEQTGQHVVKVVIREFDINKGNAELDIYFIDETKK